MKASELIKTLQEQIDKHGDIEVWQSAPETTPIDGIVYEDAKSFDEPCLVLTGYTGC